MAPLKLSPLDSLSIRKPLMGPSGSPLRLLYVAAADWAFLSHPCRWRAPPGPRFEVHVATEVRDGAAAIEAEGLRCTPSRFARGSLSPLRSLTVDHGASAHSSRGVAGYTHHAGLQACVLGMIATLDRQSTRVNALIGMGYSFTTNSVRARTLRGMISVVLRLLFNREGSTALVQNGDDLAILTGLGIRQSQIALIQGSEWSMPRASPHVPNREARRLSVSLGDCSTTRACALSSPRIACCEAADPMHSS